MDRRIGEGGKPKLEAYEICDRCGARMVVGHRHKKCYDYFILCGKCKGEVDEIEDRLNVLEGFVEEVEKLANPIIKVR